MTRRQDGRWQASIVINGKRRYFYGKTKTEVNRKIAEHKERAERVCVFADILDKWWEEHQQALVPSTVRGYTASVNRAREHFGAHPINDITPQDIDAFLRSLKDKGLGKKVVATQRIVLNLSCRYAVLHGYISVNPCASVSLPKNLRSEKRTLPSDHDIEVVKTSKWLMPYMMLYTGLRRGEILGLRYEDIDRAAGLIHVRRAIGFDRNRPLVKQPKTAAGIRDIILLPCLAERIPENAAGYIFCREDGTPLLDTQVTKMWAKWQRENGVTVTAHQLRHGYATILYEAGVGVKDAQYLLGHSTVAMTQDIYTHIRQSQLHNTAILLQSYVSK